MRRLRSDGDSLVTCEILLRSSDESLSWSHGLTFVPFIDHSKTEKAARGDQRAFSWSRFLERVHMAPKVASKSAGAAAPFKRVRQPSKRLARLAIPLDEAEEMLVAPPPPRHDLDGWLADGYVEWLASHPGHPDEEIVRGLVRSIRSGEGWQ